MLQSLLHMTVVDYSDGRDDDEYIDKDEADFVDSPEDELEIHKRRSPVDAFFQTQVVEKGECR